MVKGVGKSVGESRRKVFRESVLGEGYCDFDQHVRSCKPANQFRTTRVKPIVPTEVGAHPLDSAKREDKDIIFIKEGYFHN